MTRILATLLILVSVLAGAARAQDTAAKGFVERLLESMLSAEGRSLSLESTSISITGDVTVGRVTVRDGNDAWLEIENLAMAWRPLSLFGKQLDITSLSADRVHLVRLPQTPEGKVAAPQELSDLRAAIIRALEIRELQVDAAVLGQPVAMKLAGSGEITAAPIEIRADVTASRLDGRAGDLRAQVVLDPQTRQVKVDAQFAEGADGIVANLLHLRGSPSVDVTLSAAGSFSEWSGRLQLALDKTERFAGSAAGKTDAMGQTVTVSGGGELAPLLPLWLERPFAGPTTLAARALFPKDAGAADIDHLTLDNAAYRFTLAGTADWTGTRSNLAADLAAKDATAAFDLPVTALGASRIAGLGLSARFAGPLNQPGWTASLAWSSLQTERLGLDGFRATLRGEGLAPVAFAGDIAGTTKPGTRAALPPALLGALGGQIAGAMDQAGRIDLNRMSLVTGRLATDAKGWLASTDGRFDLAVESRTESPATGVALLDRLLAGPVTAVGRISGGGPEGLTLDRLQVTSAGLTATASGKAGSQAANLKLAASLPALDVLHDGMSGRASVDTSLDGPWDRLALRLSGTGDAVTLMGRPLAGPVLAADLVIAGTQPSGTLSLTARLDGQPVAASAALASGPDGTLAIRDFTARSGTARLSGDFAWPQGGEPVGTLAFDLPDLADVAPLFLTEATGQASGRIDMRGAGMNHETAIAFTGRNIVTPGFASATADGSITLRGLFDVPAPSGRASFGKLRIGTQRFETASITAKAAGPRAHDVTARLTGDDLALEADATVTQGPAAVRYELSRFAGKLRGVAFAASGPAVITQAGERVSLDETRFRLGKGSVRLGGQILPELDAKLRIAAVPLSAFQGLAGQPGLQGSLSGEADLAGPLSAPRGTYRLNGAGLGSAALATLGVKPLSGSAQGQFGDGFATIALEIDGGRQLSLNGTGKVALDGRSLDMTLRGETGPALFADRLARSGVRADGRVGFDLRIAGPLARPDLSGRVTLAKGVLGDADGRFTLRDAQGSAEIRNRQLRIVSLSGTTGRRGSASLSGTIGLDRGLPADLAVTVANGLYTDGSFVTARYDARLKIAGPLLEAPLAAGEVDLRDTKITLSELPKRALTPDDVKHINASRAVALQARELRRNRPADASRFNVDIRLRALDPISVSGRGLNVLMSGGMRLYGPLDGLAAEGAFQMLRGRLALPARSLEFERGTLTFERDLDPRIDFVAVSRRSDVTITLTVSGYASEPSIQVTSYPALPQEEAMARLIFDNSMLQLSPLQIAQIASYVATLSGGGDSGLLSGLQSALGLDDLSIAETEAGDTQVGITKRLNERLSIGVEQTTQSNTTRAIIDLSVTPETKVRGSIDSQGSSRIGVYYEKDY